MMEMGEKPRNTKMNKKKRKKFPVWLPSHPPSTKWRPIVFRCPKTPKTNRTFPKWEGVPNLMEQKKKDRVGRSMGS